MKPNVGIVDRIIRFAFAATLIYLYFSNAISGALAIAAIIAAVVLSLTALLSFCPAYLIFGIKTCKTQYSEHKIKEYSKND